MQNTMTKKLVNAVLAAVISLLIGVLTGLLYTVLMRSLGMLAMLLLNLQIVAIKDTVGFLLAYLITTALICKEKFELKKGLIAGLACMGLCFLTDFISGFISGLICGLLGMSVTVQNALINVLSFIGHVLAAFLAGSICFKAPQNYAPYGVHQVPYGAPQPPYNAPQAPYGAPQAPYNALQAPYNAPRAPYGAPQAPYPYAMPQQPVPAAPAEDGAQNA